MTWKRRVLLLGCFLLGVIVVDVLIVELRVQYKLRRLSVEMSEIDVQRFLGEPSLIVPWSGSFGQGISYEYYFPYLWDMVSVWPRGFPRRIRIFFLGSDGRVLEIDSSMAYSRNSSVIARRKSVAHKKPSTPKQSSNRPNPQ